MPKPDPKISSMALPDWPRANPSPPLEHAVLRADMADFVVTEIPKVLPQGSGEHLWLKLRKRGLNTQDAANWLATWANVSPREVSYAGLKDKRALATQWFSIHLPARQDPPVGAAWPAELELLEASRHTRKLRRGALQGNTFRIVLRQCHGDKTGFDAAFQVIQRQGYPNYFGEQRFGRQGSNLAQAERFFLGRKKFRDRHRRGLVLSAARSYLFNEVLAERLRQGNWLQALPGDLLMLDGSHSLFLHLPGNTEDADRITQGDVHITGPLPGKSGRLQVADAVAQLEASVLTRHADWVQGLQRQGLTAERRSLRARPKDLRYAWEDTQTVVISFSLPAGSYATALLRELAHYA